MMYRPPLFIRCIFAAKPLPAAQSSAMSGGYSSSTDARLSVLRFTTMSAPSDFTASAFSFELTVVMTLAPYSFASCIAALPSPLAPATISTTSPRLIPASNTRFRYAVANTSGMPAASAKFSRSGIGITSPASTAARSAYPPPPSSAHTLSPILYCGEFDCETTPAHSNPIHSGQPSGEGYLPLRCKISARLQPAARISINTSLSFTDGSGTSFHVSLPFGAVSIAFMYNLRRFSYYYNIIISFDLIR